MLLSNLSDIYPWQKENAHFIDKFNFNNFQNLLILSPRYIGSEIIIDKFIHKLFCRSMCGNCDNCRLLNIKQHPDLFYLGQVLDNEQLTTNNKISIDDIRHITKQVYLKPNYSPYKIVYINHCELLNINSSNSLLKILEEPPLYTKFILLGYNLYEILPTIVSRCQLLKFTFKHNQSKNDFKPQQLDNSFWINYYKFEPLNSYIISDECVDSLIKLILKPSITNIYNTVDLFYKHDITFDFIISFKIKLITDILSITYNQNSIFLPNISDNLKILVSNIDLSKLYNFYDYICTLSKFTQHPINYKLHLETIFFNYQYLLSN